VFSQGSHAADVIDRVSRRQENVFLSARGLSSFFSPLVVAIESTNAAHLLESRSHGGQTQTLAFWWGLSQKKVLIADELTKKRGKLQKRYFVLYDDLLAWFKEKDDPKPLGLVPTECFSHVTFESSGGSAGGGAGGGAAAAGAGSGGAGASTAASASTSGDTAFTLIFAGPEAEHSLCLSASSPDEAKKWIKLMQSVIEAPAMRARKQKDYKLQVRLCVCLTCFAWVRGEAGEDRGSTSRF
jgi:hypothetical protein